MVVSLKHSFVSPKVDSPDATLVQPSNWNAEHTLTQATGRLLGRTSSGTGPTEEISVGSGLTLAGGVLSAGTLDTSTFVQTTGDQTIAGTKTFSSPVPVAAGTTTAHAVRGDRSVLAGTGLTGGGNLTADRTMALTGQALALHNLATNGVIVRTGAGTVAARSLVAGTNITITNADGVAGNPTISSTAPDSLGVNQTWQAVSRAANTSYQNTTGRAIQVFVRINTTSGSGGDPINHTFQVSVNNSTWISIAYSTNEGSPVYAVVPNNWYYRASGGIFGWTELR
jgi:hypothetical protein